MEYKSITLHEDFSIDKVFSIHYFEYMSDFIFEGERHNFWEFLCVDKGDVNVMADNHRISLKKGEIIFHKPNEFHNLRANGVIAPNLMVLSFECSSPRMKYFENKVLTIGDSERILLASIISEAKKTFSSRLDDPYLEELVPAEDPSFGGEQMIKLYLEQLLILLYRRGNQFRELIPLTKSIKSKNDDMIYQRILEYMESHLDTTLTIDQICKDNLISHSLLQKLFRQKNNCGVIDYFSRLKIETSKQFIRNRNMNFTQIAESLGYTSIHYFSRQFKQITGMTPSEYASSIKILSER